MDYVIGTEDKKLFVYCVAEGDVLFITDDPTEAEVLDDADDALNYLDYIKDVSIRCLLEATDNEIKMPELFVFKMQRTFTFEKVQEII